MKNLILTKSLLMLSLLAGPLYSQNNHTNGADQHSNQQKLSPEERVKKETEKASSEFGLTADQKAKWEQACMERIAANAPLKEKMEASTTPEERKSLKSQIKTNNEKFDQTVLSFLTEEQKTKYEIFKNKKKEEKHKQNKKGMH